MTFGSSDACITVPIDGGGIESPARRIGRIARGLAESPWTPVALRAGAIALAMALLSLLGAISMSRSFEGKLVLPSIDSKLGAAWLAPDREAPSAPAAEDAGATGPAHGSESESASCSDSGAPAVPGVTADGKVILNTATATDLTRLPGVGKRRAEQIVALRTRLKGFRRTTDLLRVKGIGVRGLRRISPHVVLNPPAASDGGAAPVRDGG